MVDYQDEQLFPFPRDRVWKLLQDHLDDSLISRIHPLVKQQRTISKSGDSTVVDRTIDARGKLLASQWRVTARPPDYFRWEILASHGPYATGGWMEHTYTDEGAQTRIRSRGNLTISVLPFFLPQRTFVRRVLDMIDDEDQRYLRG
jgi:hypothetical protein